MSFDPIITLNRHVALLALLKVAEQEVNELKGITLGVAKVAGRVVVMKLDQSRATMKANNMWVQDNPIGEMRYRYSLHGRRHEYEVSPSELKLHTAMILLEMEREVERIDKKSSGIPLSNREFTPNENISLNWLR